ncbi:Phosphatidylinositol 4-phosphate 5-kinase 9, partial [Cucurbita argyrosperma subsp. sororia]
MSGPVAIVDNVEGGLSSAERTKSLDAITSKEFTSAIINGETVHTSESARFRVGELLLVNGELYSGSLLGNIPEGTGKYVWSDGCIYEGEWRRGMRHGNGKIRFPSGAVYEGEFSGGYMHGTGTYTGPDNLVYKGRWKLNLKHGLGYQVYPNGDIFEGSWMQGTPEGPGKYTWVNGNVYLGNMKAGAMSGKGTLTWINGDSFEGKLVERGLKDGKGSFYPKGSRLPAGQEIYLKALRKKGLLPDSRKQNHAHIHHAISGDMGNFKVGENQQSSRVTSDKLSKGSLLNLEQYRSKNVSLERRWSLEVSIEKVLGHDSSSGLSDYEMGGNFFLTIIKKSKTKTEKKLVKEVNKPGEMIIKGHRSYDLMLSLQLGIRNLREMFKIDAADYMMSICGNDALRELSSPGKSELRIHRRFDLKGSSLGRSADKVEIDENTILKDLDLNYSFYLEPTWREALLKQIEIDSKFLEVQNIMDYSLLLGVHYRAPQQPQSHLSYNRSMRADGLGILAEDDPFEDISTYPQGLVLVPRIDDDSVVVGSHIRGSRLRASSAAGDGEVDLLLPGTARLQIQLGVNMPARAEQIPGKEEKQMFHEAYDVVLYLGIIDILQEYNMSKKIEHAYKSLQFDSISISSVDPTFYSQRFLQFIIQRVFPQNARAG